jgi:hypothetical protein
MGLYNGDNVFSMRYRLRPNDNLNVSPFRSKVEDVGYVGLYNMRKGNTISSHSWEKYRNACVSKRNKAEARKQPIVKTEHASDSNKLTNQMQQFYEFVT